LLGVGVTFVAGLVVGLIATTGLLVASELWWAREPRARIKRPGRWA
jgi:hypothetical protein